MADDRSLQFFIGVNVQKFLRGLETANQGVNKFTKNTESKLAKGFANSAKGMIKGFAAPLTALATAGTVYQAAKQVAELDAKITRMGIDSNMSTAQMLLYKNQIMDLGIKSGASSVNLLELGAAALDSYRSFDLASKNMGFMTKVMQASGAGAKETGDYFGSLHDKAKLTGEDIETLTARFYSFGKSQDSSMKFSEVMSNIPQMIEQARGYLGKDASLKSIGDFVITTMFTGSPTAVRTAMGTMASKTKELKALGFDLSKGLPSIAAVTKKISESTTNEAAASKLRITLLGQESWALQKIWTELESYNRALGRTGDKADIYTDANKKATAYETALNRLNRVFLKIADAALGPILADMADQLSKIDPTALEGFARAAGGVGKVLVDIANGLITFGAAYDDLTSSAADWLMGGAQSQGGKAAMNTRQAAAQDAANKNIAEGKRKIAQGDVMGGRAQVRGGLAQGKWVMQNPQEFEGSGHGIADVFRNSENTLQGQLDQALNDAYDRGASQAVDANGKAIVPNIKQDINVYVDGDKKPSRSTTTTRVGTQNSVLEEKK